MNDTTVIPCILNTEVSSEKNLKGEHLIIDWKVIMEGYDGFRINCSVNTTSRFNVDGHWTTVN